jgi:organic radical activating enzyme
VNPLEQDQAGKLLCVMPTFQCTAECAHCGTISSPRDETWLPLEQALASIDQAAELGYAGVVFTGGEPTLATDSLLEAMRHAASRRLPVRLVTNAHWAVDEVIAESLLFEWMCAGLCQLNVSTGDRHARFVPLESVARAIAAADRLQLPATVLVESGGPADITASLVRERLAESVTVAEWRWSALTAFPASRPDGAVNRANLHNCTGCESMFTNITVQANGTISPCCGLGIRLLPELQSGHVGVDTLAGAERRAREDPLKQRIRAEGPERILAWAAERDPRIQWEDLYAHRCQACIRLHRDPLVRAALAGAGQNTPAAL